jgi:molybdate transport system substrate-binding protein
VRHRGLPHILLLHLAVSGLLGCKPQTRSEGAARAPQRSDQDVVLFGAASTANALDEIAREFHRDHKVRVRVSYASSATLARQIEDGAGADVFVSAAGEWADYLEEKGLVAQRRDLLTNRIVVIVPSGSTIDVKKPTDLLSGRIRHVALADPEAAPAGVYAKQALSKLGLWEQLKSKVVPGADVRQALSHVETGAAEAGIVYATDAAISTGVRVVIQLSPELTEPIRYPALLLREGQGNPAAVSLFEHLTSPAAAGLFQKHGFTVLTSAASSVP